MANLVTLSVKIPRNTEVTPEAAQTFLATLTQLNKGSTLHKKFLAKFPKSLALEIAFYNSQIQFLITCDPEFETFIRTQLQSTYPLSFIEKTKDPLENLEFDYIKLGLSHGNNYPLATYKEFREVDPMASLLSVLSKGHENEITIIQLALEAAGDRWQTQGLNYAEHGQKKEDGTYGPRPDAALIKEKVSYPGFTASIRIITNTARTLNELTSAFSVYSRSDANSLYTKPFGILVNKKKAREYVRSRNVTDNDIVNVVELATLWHLPSEKIKIPSIAWGKAVMSEPPESLAVAGELSDEEKQHVNFIAKTTFHNKDAIFGIKDHDRLRHIWAIGKTGSGKSTLLENMAIDDFKKGRGVAYLDPHGDSAELLLNYIPKDRINDTIYFNPSDRDFPIVLNPLEVTNREEAELVVAGLMSIFTKIWANVWSARMEYILRNTFLTLADVPDTTLEDVLKILSNQSYRNKIVSKLSDRALINFWEEEFNKMPADLQKEAIAPIQNKVGQFVTSPTIRRIIGTPKSSISIDEIMNEKKILIANLSQGRLGEDNAALVGAMLITKFQLAAMRRVDAAKETRVPFYLYVDEFQNFATDSFIKILSEARKFGLALCLANQYMAQIPEHIQKAILGNAGTMVSFAVGAADANIVFKELAEVFSANDLVNLSNHQIAIKLMIDGHTSRPFLATTLPTPKSANDNREKIIRVSRERYARRVNEAAEVRENIGGATLSPLQPSNPNVPRTDTPEPTASSVTDRSSHTTNERSRTIFESLERKEK